MQIVEPNIEQLPASLQGANVTLTSLEQALEEADVVCVLVKHRPFIAAVAAVQAKASVVDAVGLLA